MDYAALLTEVQTDPKGLGYAAFLPDSPGQVVELLNARTFSLAKSMMVSERGLMAKYPTGPVAADAVLTKLEAYAAASYPLSSVLKRTLKFLAQPEGIDMGDATTQAMIGILVAQGAITAEEGDALKSIAKQPTSRAEVLKFGIVEEADLHKAGVI